MRIIYITISILLIIIFTSYGQSDSEITTTIVEVIENIEWDSSGPKNTDSIVIGVLENSRILSELQKEATASNRKISVKTKSLTDDISDCHIIFTPAQDLKNLAKVLKKVSNTNIITISNAKDFARYGVMINLVNNGKIEVNKMVLDGAHVKLNPKLMNDAIKI